MAKKKRASTISNRIPLPFEKAVEGLLGIKPKPRKTVQKRVVKKAPVKRKK